jgi:hypothetical protein
MLDDEQHVEHPQGGRRHGEEVHGGDRILVVAQERHPAFHLAGVDRLAWHVAASWRLRDTGADHGRRCAAPHHPAHPFLRDPTESDKAMSLPKRKKTEHKKISETFLEFMAPSLEQMGMPPGERERDSLIKVCWSVWNAVIFADFSGRTDLLDKLLDPSLSRPATIVLIKTLIERKRSPRFRNDNLLLGEYKIKYVDGERRLWAEARATPSPRR